MSRRSTSTRPSSNASSGSGQTATIAPAADPPKAPSLESLLKSCGALQSVIRQKLDEAETNDGESSEYRDCDSVENNDAEFDSPSQSLTECGDSYTDTNPESESCDSNARDASADGTSTDGTARHANTAEVHSPAQPHAAIKATETANSIDLLSILKLMREESRASIQELKASQEAAAAGQSAVLKALFEVISRSSSARDNVGDTIEQKLFEFEERILHRMDHSTGTSAAHDAKLSNAASHSAPAAAKKNGDRSWEEIRNDLLLNGDARESQGETDIREARDLAHRAAVDKSNSEKAEAILEVPRAVDPETLSDAELREVFWEREQFISTLIGRLRHSHQQSSGHLPAEKLKAMGEFLPEEVAAQVMQTLQQLDELARIGELELSLERARLSRQVSKLEESRQLLEHHARQLGLTLTDDGTVSNPKKSANRGTSSRRWLSKLGFGQ